MKSLILTITVLFCLHTMNAKAEERLPDAQERAVIFANLLGKTLEYEKSHHPAQYLLNGKVLLEVSALLTKETEGRSCRDFLLIDYSESEAGREVKGTACRKSKEIWYPINS